MDKPRASLDLAAIGNCTYGALIDQQARLVWSCLPRFDSDPVFCSLLTPLGDLAEHGVFAIELEGLVATEQEYLENTAILVTRLSSADGSVVEITDFAPRFRHFDRMFRPTQIVRQIRPAAGKPRIRVLVRPLHDYGARLPEVTRGSNHVRYLLSDLTLRLTTDTPVSYILEETSFVLHTPITLLLGPDESLEGSPARVGRDLLEQTLAYWRDWVRSLSIPFEWQTEVIRAAITLKLSTFEETGGVIAAMTTSIPEAAGSGRTWDYRFCWLRDSYFVVHALNRLGATRTMEHYLYFITNLIAHANGKRLQPVYGITTMAPIDEAIVESLAGYCGSGPVRRGNQAYEQIQNDVYGAVVLSLSQLFFDQRLDRQGNASLLADLEGLGHQALDLYNEPDAGLWEYRGRKHVHTFSSVLCWAALDRLARISERMGIKEKALYWREAADRLHQEICKVAWDPERNSFRASIDEPAADAALLLLPDIGFVSASDPRFLGTLAAIERELRHGDYLFRYTNADDFGVPETAFNICTFWYINALAAVGRRDEARALFENMLARRNHVGLLSEDLDPRSGELWGNFPQTYSMVGLISSAMRLSQPWESAF